MLQVEHLFYSYDLGRIALMDICLEIPRGQIVGLLGSNGAGKTTLLRCLAGLHAPSQGSITLDGVGGERIRRALSFVSGEGAAFGMLTPREMGEFMQESYPQFLTARYEKLLEFFELPERPVVQLSKGQRSRAELAIGFCRGASYLLLDEPFSGKDVFTRQDFLRLMAGSMREGESILLSSHQVEEMEQILDRAIILHEGKVVSDVLLEELQDSGRTLLELFAEQTGYDPYRAAKLFEEIE